ncbi:hypothetical protein HK097_007743 [Rhizophlyctis rosea]|uniref:rhomboid protease n=1 Tax=Rhizophlyctis rosea TaxID=64517 RepID=A0AAD5X228_9FUNG|nr:hypothetical protein HK097_007743 [Rhizophlyctis rosea]
MPLPNISDLSTQTRSHISSLPLATRLIAGTCIIVEILRLTVASSWVEAGCFRPNAGLSLIYRPITSEFLHSNLFHLLLNLIALLLLGPRIEKAYGTLQTIQLTFLLPSIAAIAHSLIAVVADFLFTKNKTDEGWTTQCSIGLSGLLFAFITIDVSERPSPRSLFGFLTIPSTIYPWVLLIITQLILPNASFLGHLSGIIAASVLLSGYIDRLRLSATLASRIENSRPGQYLAHQRSFVPHPGPTLPSYEAVGANGGGADAAGPAPWTMPGAPGGPPLPSYLSGGGEGTQQGKQDSKFPGEGRTLAPSSST